MDRHDPPDADELDRTKTVGDRVDSAKHELYSALQTPVTGVTLQGAFWTATQIHKALKALDSLTRR